LQLKRDKDWRRRYQLAALGGREVGHRRSIALLAPFGVWLGHAFMQELAQTRAPKRAGHMHSSLGFLVDVLLPLSLAALAAVPSRIRQRSPAQPWWSPESPLLVPLAVAQVLVFMEQEAIKHVVVGLPLVSVLTDRAVLVGLALQVVAATALVALVRMISRLIEVLTRDCRPPRPVAPLVTVPESTAPGRWSVLTTTSPRGPPSAVVRASARRL
jgi:hypothetical protein